MRIVIDMQGAQSDSRFRGIGRYTLSLAQAMVRNRGEHEFILALNGLFLDTIEPIRTAFDGLLLQENIRVWYAPGPVRKCEPGNEWRREVAELIREAFIFSLEADVVHITSMFEGYIDDAVTSIGCFDPTTPVSVSFYDLIPLLNPVQYLDLNPAYAQYYYHKIEHLRRASLMLAISESARQEGIDQFGEKNKKVVNVSTAADANFHPVAVSNECMQALREKFGILRPFVLYTGGADQRKNLPRLLKAYARLSPDLRAGHQLVLAGKILEDKVSHIRAVAKSAGMRADELIFTGYVQDDELVQLYNLCRLFVFPSWHEGFGLPALEAMACGAAVIGANSSSVPEVIGCTNALFDPYDESAISFKMAQVLEDNSLQADLAAHGLQQAKQFSWDDSARRAIAAFETLHRARTRIDSLGGRGTENLLDRLIQAIAAVVPANISDVKVVSIAHSLSFIQTYDAPKQLFVDISELAQRDAGTGVQRVTRSVLKELIEHPPIGYSVKPVFATIKSQGYYYASKFTAQFLNTINDEKDGLIEYHPGDLFLGLDLQHHTTRVQASYLSQMRSNGVCIYFVVYDLLPVLLPHCWPPEHSVNKVHHEWLSVISQFDGAACISRTVADELAEWQRVHAPKRLRPFKICWFHLGADVENSVPTCGLPDNASYVLEKLAHHPTFLTVGTIEPRKGQAQALGAFDLLWEQGVDANLVIVGKEGWMVENLVKHLRNHPELDKRLFWLEGISDEYLEKVYAASTCLLAASEGEGFGLPLIEAAQHKVPIISRDIPVFREVARERAYYFDGKSPEDLAHAITSWLALYHAGQHPKSDNMPWLTWKESVQQLKDQLSLNGRH